MKSGVLANVSHEIRAPMNAITGMMHLALRTDLNEMQRNYLSKVETAAKGLLGSINGILDFSRIEAGKIQSERVPFTLEDVLQSLADAMRRLASLITEAGLEATLILYVVIARLSDAGGAARARQLGRLVADYDFDAAMPLLEGLAHGLGVQLDRVRR